MAFKSRFSFLRQFWAFLLQMHPPSPYLVHTSRQILKNLNSYD